MTPTSQSVEEFLADWNPLDPKELANPYETYALARREAPVFYSRFFDAWVVTRYDDILSVTKDTKAFTSRDTLYCGPVPDEVCPRLPNGYPWDYPTLINNDPPAHARVRRLSNEGLRPSDIQARAEDVQAVVDRLIEAFVADGQVDFMSQYAQYLPGYVLCLLLGVDEADTPQVVHWADEMVVMLDPTLSEERRLEAARNAADFQDYCADFIAARQRDLGDDMVSRLIAARTEDENAPALTEPELVSIFSQLLVGGNETTRNFLGNMLLRLLEHPDQLEAVRQDPGLAESAVEESLRHSSPTKGLYRRTVTDVEIAGVTIPKGRLAVVMWASANRDETVFDDPDRYDIRRANANKHQAFSRHAHFCPGAPLARLEGKITLERILARLPNLRRADDAPLRWQPIPLHQGLQRLDVAWDPA